MPKKTKRRLLEERIVALQTELHMVRTYLLPQLEQARADFGNLINYFEAKFNEFEQWFAGFQTDDPKPKPKKKGKRR